MLSEMNKYTVCSNSLWDVICPMFHYWSNQILWMLCTPNCFPHIAIRAPNSMRNPFLIIQIRISPSVFSAIAHYKF